VPLTVRDATHADVPRLVEIARRAFLSAFGFTAPFALLQQWMAEDKEPAWYERDWRGMQVCERQGEIAGLVQPIVDEINGLWVHPDHQGQGVGSLLLAEGETRILQAGFARCWLVCSGYNRRALPFYEARGYAIVTELRTSHPGGIEELSFRMERTLIARPA
jgi:ribosomal protein S18 acetylase RimI-like enzyme